MLHEPGQGNALPAVEVGRRLAALSDFYQTLTPQTLARFAEFYTDDAFFKDPFNEVRGRPAIERIFHHMFTQVAVPRFVVTGQFPAAAGAMLLWEFHFATGRPGRRQVHCIQGASHLQFAADGRVCHHRDYWDSSEELYMKVPLLGGVLRFLRRRLAAA